MELRHSAVSITARLDKCDVTDLKLFLFLFGIGVRLRHANARNTALKRGVYDGVALAAVGKRTAHLAARNGRNYDEERNARENDEQR